MKQNVEDKRNYTRSIGSNHSGIAHFGRCNSYVHNGR